MSPAKILKQLPKQPSRLAAAPKPKSKNSNWAAVSEAFSSTVSDDLLKSVAAEKQDPPPLLLLCPSPPTTVLHYARGTFETIKHLEAGRQAGRQGPSPAGRAGVRPGVRPAFE